MNRLFSMNTITIQIPNWISKRIYGAYKSLDVYVWIFLLSVISIITFLIFYDNGLGLAYNDARSRLNIGRRTVEGLQTGLAQLGSVWLPLTHALMIPTVWHDFFWHTGLSGAIQSMISYVMTAIIIMYFLKELGVGKLGQIIGALVFAFNLNVLYMQSTALTELLLLALMTAGVYEIMMWHKDSSLLRLIKSSAYIMLSTLIRYDGWFLFFYVTVLIFIHSLRKRAFRSLEGSVLMFCTVGGVGIMLWLLWNLVIFNDPLYFAFGPYSAHTQQAQLEEAGNLETKRNLPLSLQLFTMAMAYNSGAFITLLGFIGFVMLMFDKKIALSVRLASSALLAPFIFNVLALYLGHSVLFIQGISGNSWFNVRYGLMMMPSIAIFIGYMIHRLKDLRYVLIGLISFNMLIAIINPDSVTIDDGRFGASQKNVAEVSGWLKQNASDSDELILISAASHDAIIFSTGLPMKRFIHEGARDYWDNAVAYPDLWARWIIMRTYDEADLTYRLIKDTPGFENYEKMASYPFADIYELKPEFIKNVTSLDTLNIH